MTLSRRESGAKWLKSSYSSGGGACVEVRFHDERVLIRDSKYPTIVSNGLRQKPIIDVSYDAWTTFLLQLRGDISVGSTALSVTTCGDGATLVDTSTGLTLHYTTVEWHAFVDGVRTGEFEFEPPRLPSEQIQAARIQARAAIAAALIGTGTVVSALILQHVLQ
jgi:Domain of unknown function (DUF397)